MSEMILKAALDIGSSKVKAILGELSEDGEKIRVISHSEITSKGVRKAIIENTEQLSECIKEVVRDLEIESGKKIKKVSIGVAGKHLKSKTKKVKYTLPETEEFVKKEHLENLYSLAKEAMEKDESVIKKEIYNLRVDNSGIVRNPIGVKGGSLEGDVHLITAKEEELEKMITAVNRAGLEVEEITLNSFASAKAILTEEDKKMGVALVDIGEGSTDLIIFKNDKLIYSKSIALGSMHYITDLAYIFKLDKVQALKVKNLYDRNKSEETITIISNGEEKEQPTATIKELFEARSGDVVQRLSKALEESGFKGYLGNGIILTGGAVAMDEMVEVIGKNLNYKVKVGVPVKIRGLVEAKPAYSTALGILLEALEKEHIRIKDGNNKKDTIEAEPIKKEEVSKVVEKEKVVEEKKVDKKEEKKKENNDNKTNKKEPKEKKNGLFGKVGSWVKEFI